MLMDNDNITIYLRISQLDSPWESPEFRFQDCDAITWLNLWGVTRLHPGCFRGLPELTWITITRSAPEEFLPESFSDNSSTTDLRRLERGTFSGLSRLDVLQLKNIGLEHIDDGAFESLTILSNLDLSWNQLSTLNVNTFEGIFGVYNTFMILDLSHNRITEIQGEVFHGLLLWYVDLSAQVGSLQLITGDPCTDYYGSYCMVVHTLDLTENPALLANVDNTTFASWDFSDVWMDAATVKNLTKAHKAVSGVSQKARGTRLGLSQNDFQNILAEVRATEQAPNHPGPVLLRLRLPSSLP